MTIADPLSHILVMTLARSLLAVQAETGVMLWRLEIPASARRLFRVGPRLMVITHAQVLCVDFASGTMIGAVDLPFQACNGVVNAGKLYVNGTNGAACIDQDGRVVWSVGSASTATFSTDFTMVCRAANGAELWRFDPGAVRSPPALVVGDQVAQPDLH
ncbi:MAG: PQQ-binding-like beta-propeller repeat protein [Myxococcales bacterium]|nr:PQQ-binding-like beta-propeller repeat protein [Myxococcales bacterium]